ncbi:hydrogenase-4 component F [Campylobacter sputorum subsp. bubulus]|uniref:Hydrogenase-4 component F n=1 Tax=Campylobacter sputorum subsp. sputorum TaxID=32024 RepID=A0A381DJ94_9BACT|nr:proton-conducting transporter membrane subunit [Campylobacter sputorum]ASM35712.1 hydrogenase-4, component F [Campylobacter sputorum aubsp. sputorum RM3237]KAB0580692.1 hydrogenase 4 subunit F [Campylobacter sputorum subsp. sputorum]QEL05902.1 hydrogenase-4, antiporter-like subunit [Campylobacter sputorum subsp. sputorum]SUX08992.1 hydrogenase-4 component F [Campylobacter sputorum subsp. bubulus]SUX10680.1 hydrogenase-4 component F [Campylobacter sputorum subsp. sputorum]
MNILVLILILPVIFGVTMFFSPLNFKVLQNLHIAFNTLISAFLLCAVGLVVKNDYISYFNEFLFLDSLGAIFLSLIAITGFLVNLYMSSYMKWEIEAEHITLRQLKNYFSLTFIFTFTMTLSVVCNNIAFMWAAIEATTLSSVFLVAVNKDKKSTESGYKYIVICSIGLAFALYATILLYCAGNNNISGDSMLFTNLLENAENLNQDALKLIFIFALIGFGTKAGLVPTHTWLPDVHAQGPAPTSALLSGILLKCAMLGLIKYYAIVGKGIGFDFVQTIMVVSGLITLFVAGFFLIRQHDVKRMFAYHSIVHMGVIAFGLGVGSFIGIFAAIFHCMAHSFTKALAFCVTGNMAKIYGTKDMTKMGSMIKIAPLTTVLFGISICSLVGVPGFAIFVSEFWIFKAAALNSQYILMILFAIALAIIFIADFSHFFLASFGKVNGEVKYAKEMTLAENLPLILLALLVISFGIWQFDVFIELINNSVKIIMR